MWSTFFKVMIVIFPISLMANPRDKILEEYLRNHHDKIKLLYEKLESLETTEKTSESKRLNSLYVFGEVQTAYSESLPQSPLILRDQEVRFNLRSGLQQRFYLGLRAEVGFDSAYTQTEGARFFNPSQYNYTGKTDSKNYYQSVYFQFEMPLLKNFGAKDLHIAKANIETSESLRKIQVMAEIERESNEIKNMIWTIFLKEELRKIYEVSLKRIQKMLNFVQKKVSMGVEEKGSLYQLEALKKSYEIQIQKYLDDRDEIISILKKVDIVYGPDVLNAVLDTKNFHKFSLESYVGNSSKNGFVKSRLSTVAHIHSLKIETVQMEGSLEDSKPQLDAFLYGRGQSSDDSFGGSFSNEHLFDHPEVGVGLRFRMNLDRDLEKSIQSQKRKGLMAQNSLMTLTLEDELKAYETYIDQFKSKVQLLENLEALRSIQEKKLNNESRLLDLGRSSLFQVLQFEREVISAQESYYMAWFDVKNTELLLKSFQIESPIN